MIRFGSVCSGIEAASVAWRPLGWRAAWLAEIEPFPCAVLAHHYPEVPNLGDMATITRRVLTGEVEAPDVFTGGTPCQAFSVAGLRRSLDDARGNLSLTFCEIADAIDHVRVARGDQPAVIVWENVPGVLSTKDNAFGCFLAGLAGEDEPLLPPGGRWTDAGLVHGPARAVAWRTLDAQYFGVAQRRRRVFVVASARDGFDPASVLFEWDRVRRDSAPRRDAREGAAAGSGAGAGGGVPDTARCVTAGEGKRGDWETCTMVAQPVAFDTTQVTSAANYSSPKPGDPCHPLAAGAHPPAIAFAQNTRDEVRVLGGDGAIAGALMAEPGMKQQTYIDFSAKDYGADAGELAPTLRAMGHAGSHANGGGQVAIAFHPTQDPISSEDGTTHAMGTGSNGGCATVAVAVASPLFCHLCGEYDVTGGICRWCGSADSVSRSHLAEAQQVVAVTGDVFHTLRAEGFDASEDGTGRGAGAVTHGMAVRRLTPRECERLQGFPDDYTLIPWRKKPADQCPDGPRYKALGNSWAVPVARWVGQRIAEVLK